VFSLPWGWGSLESDQAISWGREVHATEKMQVANYLIPCVSCEGHALILNMIRHHRCQIFGIPIIIIIIINRFAA